MKLYSQSFLLAQLVSLLKKKENRPLWVEIEAHICQPCDAIAYFTQQKTKETQFNPIMDHSREVWAAVHRLTKQIATVTLEVSLWENPSLLIDSKPIMWKKWANKGLYRIADLYEKGVFKSFTQLFQQFRLERQEFWKFLQIRHCILSLPQITTHKPPARSELVTYIELMVHFPHLVSSLYQYLMKWTWPQKVGRRVCWQNMIGGQLTDQDWEELVREMSCPMRDAHLKLMQYKIVNNLYWTPSRMYTLKLRQTPTCWRCQGEIGDIAHMIYFCNKLNRFWDRIIANINSHVTNTGNKGALVGNGLTNKAIPELYDAVHAQLEHSQSQSDTGETYYKCQESYTITIYQTLYRQENQTHKTGDRNEELRDHSHVTTRATKRTFKKSNCSTNVGRIHSTQCATKSRKPLTLIKREDECDLHWPNLQGTYLMNCTNVEEVTAEMPTQISGYPLVFYWWELIQMASVWWQQGQCHSLR
nr:PREDICTED: uncharacterized protein LOC106704038 [Latimeria chalumnae]|eukprot:XP_014345684.1 PREDICTED: uncharacterized protein LOC106704038 [Latimeria chalumnae]